MISDVDLVQNALSEIEKGNFAKVSSLISDDFRFKGPSLVSLDKEHYLASHEALIKAIPDWKFNPSGWRAEGNRVLMNIHITGTFTKPLHYPFPFMKDEAPTNQRISLPEEPTRVTVENGLITAIEADTVAGGGIMGVLKQLGVKAPVPAGV